MKTTLDIPEERLEALMAIGNFSSKKEAVNTAIDSYLQQWRVAQLLRSAGTMDDFMTRGHLEHVRRDG